MGKERENIAWSTWMFLFHKNSKSIPCRGHKNSHINTLQSLTTCTFYSHSFFQFYSTATDTIWNELFMFWSKRYFNTSSVEHVNERKCLIKLHLVALPHFQNQPDLLAAWMSLIITVGRQTIEKAIYTIGFLRNKYKAWRIMCISLSL